MTNSYILTNDQRISLRLIRGLMGHMENATVLNIAALTYRYIVDVAANGHQSQTLTSSAILTSPMTTLDASIMTRRPILWEKCFVGAQLSRHIDLKIRERKKTLVAFISLCNP
ncbi:Uncharacterised protein [Klebsiella pneumoniae]|nr:Uncharacterised protein [Klebsiella pneumoniae]